jgi:Subtilase family
MRDLEPRLVDDGVTVEQEIEIDRPGAVPGAVTHASELALDLEHPIEELTRCELGPEGRRRVEEAGLVLVADGIGLPEGRNGEDFDLGIGVEPLHGSPDRPFPVSEVCAQTDVENPHPVAMVSSVRRLGVCLALLLVAAPSPAQATPAARLPTANDITALGGWAHTMVGVRADARAERLLARNGGTIVAPDLHIWRLPSGTAQRLIPRLRALGALRYAEPDRPVPGHSHLSDPLAAPHIGWHLYRVGADRAEPPGPGVPLTVIDSGLDTTHMEFRARPNTVVLNEQQVQPGDEYHGTIVASTAAAPTDAQGTVGVYPQAVLRAFDLWFLSESLIVQGISRATASGVGVINLSLGGDEPSRAMYEATINAFGRGTIIVAAAGNERLNGDPPIFPAGFPHVLTVGSTGMTDRPSEFSSTNPALDLAAPGEQIPWQHPTDPGIFSFASGTSFSSPIVAAATAWVWTARPGIEKTQLFDLMRYSARDIAPRGFDNRTGWGLLDIPRALTRPLPPIDPMEPNDDVDHVKAHGIFRSAARPLTSPGRRKASLRARLHRTEDPDDVYRFWVPARRVVTAKVTPTANVSVAAWRRSTRSVFERGAARRRDLIAVSTRPGGRPEVVRIENQRRSGFYAYIDVFPARGVRSAQYTLAISSRVLP